MVRVGERERERGGEAAEGKEVGHAHGDYCSERERGVMTTAARAARPVIERSRRGGGRGREGGREGREGSLVGERERGSAGGSEGVWVGEKERDWVG